VVEVGFPVLEDQFMDCRSANPGDEYDGGDAKSAIRDI
jgi:hypothetical protein